MTGPRGCGKTYCSEEAIHRARDLGLIGGWRFLQGNREIPRDTLSEDLLVIVKSEGDNQPRPHLISAIPLRGPDTSAWEHMRREEFNRHVEQQKKQFPDWPAIPSMMRNRSQALKLWKPDDWIVLFLDEINRFGDGFLDSLLSLTEEGKIVRRGEDYYVPMVVVATANPPGYDVTAKKLSPPLQARIARSFRLAQPEFSHLVDRIIKPRLAGLAELYNHARGTDVSDELARLAAAVTLCLWGNPDPKQQGSHFLTKATRYR